MKLTKYGHACIVLEDQGKKLVIDPGSVKFTPELGELTDVAAVVVTHIHQDHYSPEHLQAILAKNPDVPIFTTQEVADDFKAGTVMPVKAGDETTAGPFELQFGGELHAVVHASFPRAQNITIMVNDRFFYPGDSYTMPDRAVDVLAVPVDAPWMKIGDSMDYVSAIKPKRCVPTHDALLSDAGHDVYNNSLKIAADRSGSEFTYLHPGESIEI